MGGVAGVLFSYAEGNGPHSHLMRPVSLAALALLAPLFTANRVAAQGSFLSLAVAPAHAQVVRHRMAVSRSEDETIVWDEVRWEGEPEEFVWVTPVDPEAMPEVELADPELFDVLHEVTYLRFAPSVFPTGVCPPRNASTSEPLDADTDSALPVETVTLAGGESFLAWTAVHGYHVSERAAAILEGYEADQQGFLVLRFTPEEGQHRSVPIRVRHPSGDVILPLQLASIGAAESLDVRLWIFAAGGRALPRRVEVMTTSGLFSQITFDWTTNTVNYPEVVRDFVDSREGALWINETTEQLRVLLPTYAQGPDLAADELYLATRRLASPYLTRLHTIVDPEELPEELDLAPAGIDTVPREVRAGRSINLPVCSPWGDDTIRPSGPFPSDVPPPSQPPFPSPPRDTGARAYGSTAICSFAPAQRGSWAPCVLLAIAFVSRRRARASRSRRA